ncbi:hypothetical protein GCM10009827_054320 [Dactylosporangium maewongense]|uniref:L-erythro-3,5-diaminohexanoate dehydrogenase N-terminal domain-containing protein n=1 Tax=Dactylosporangium maewongense TaxID=634393 RepID=A0ABP4LRH8_9ACTN
MLPQAADRLDPDPVIGADEVRIRVERLNLDAASFHQLRSEHGGDGGKVRAAVLDIVRSRGKMHNPVTGSGGMLIGTVDAAGPASPLGLRPGDRVATLVSLTLTPLHIADDLTRWDGLSEQVPCDGHAILFARSIAAVLPADLDPQLSLAVLDVCGAPALVARVVTQALHARTGSAAGPAAGPAAGGLAARPLTVAVLGAAGKSGSLSLAAAHDAARTFTHNPTAGATNTTRQATPSVLPAVSGGAAPTGPSDAASATATATTSDAAGVAASETGAHSPAGGHTTVAGNGGRSYTGGGGQPAALVRTVGVVRDAAERDRLAGTGLADAIVIADARDAVGLAAALDGAGGAADVTVVCVDVPGCEHAAVLATAAGGTVVFFSMATSFPAAALGAEGLAADVTMLIGNGYVPGHADYALRLLRSDSGVRNLFQARLRAEAPPGLAD